MTPKQIQTALAEAIGKAIIGKTVTSGANAAAAAHWANTPLGKLVGV